MTSDGTDSKMGFMDAYTKNPGNKTKMIIGIALGIAVLALIIGLAVGIPLSKRSTSNLIKAREILEKYPLIDGHNDYPFQLYLNVKNQIDKVDMTSDLRQVWNISHTDIPRLRMGRVGAQFWAAFVRCDTLGKDAVRRTLEQIDVIHRYTEKYPETFTFVRSADEIEAAFKDGKIGSLIGVEGGHSIDNSLPVLRMFYDLGVRYMTLTHSCDLPWADMWNETGSIGGLSPFGKQVVREMNRLGMLVDLSHVSQDVMRDAIHTSSAPVIFSHSSAFAICSHLRNVPDDVLLMTKKNGGVVMVNFYNVYISCDKKANLTQVADHIDYIRKVAGVETVGIGGDYDGVDLVPEGLEDVSKYPDLFAELMNRGWSEEDLGKLAGNNLLRAFRGAEKVKGQPDQPIQENIPEDLVANRSCRTTDIDSYF